MSFAIPIYDPAAVRCHAILDRLVNQPVGSFMHDEGWRHGAEWIARAEGIRHPHPSIAFDGDATIRALVQNPNCPIWRSQGVKWLEQFESARRCQGYYRPRILCLPACRDTADLVAVNID